MNSHGLSVQAPLGSKDQGTGRIETKCFIALGPALEFRLEPCQGPLGQLIDIHMSVQGALRAAACMLKYS